MPQTPALGAEDGEVQDAEVKEADAKKSEFNVPAKVEVQSQAGEEAKRKPTDPSSRQDPPPTKPTETTDSKPTSDERSTAASRPGTPHHTVPKKPEPVRLPPPSSVAHHPSLPSRPESLPSGRLPPPPIRLPGQPPERRDLRSHERDRPVRRRDHEPSVESDHRARSYNRSNDSTFHEYARQEVRESDVSSRSADERYAHSSKREPRSPFPDQSSADRYNRGRQPVDGHSSRERDQPRDAVEPTSRGPPSQSLDSSGMNPARAALMNGALDRPEMSIKGQAERSRPDRELSPSRRNERDARFDRRDDTSRAGRRHPSPDQRESYPPGPRYQPDRSDNTRPPPLRPREIDMNHGRLNQDPIDPPSGPRTRSSGSMRGRGAAPPQPHLNTTQATSTTEPPASSGPNRPTRSSSLSESNQVTPSTPADTSGIHPDRLRNLQSPGSESSSMRPPIVQNRSVLPTPAQASPPTAPSGPRGASSSGPSPTTRAPPSGPNFDVSSRGNRGNRNPLAAVNSHLQQASQGSNGDRGQGMTIRGRSGLRDANPSSNSTPASPMNGPGSRSDALSSAVSVPAPRQELFPARGQASTSAPSPNMPPPRHDDTRRLPPRSGPSSHRDDRRFDSSQEGDNPPSRMPSGGRRGDHMDENAYSGRRQTRHSSSSRVDETEQDGLKRGHGQDDSRRPYEREAGHHERDREGRDYGRDRDRPYEGHRELREPPSRSMRRDDTGGPPSQSPMYPLSDRGRGDSRGYGPGRPGGDERDLRTRDREPRDLRSSARSDRDYSGRVSDNPNNVTPQKRRGPEDAPDGGSFGGGRGGMYRNSNDSKRPRRGP